MICGLRYVERYDPLTGRAVLMLEYQDDEGVWHPVPHVSERKAIKSGAV